jgi:hypothetical protein
MNATPISAAATTLAVDLAKDVFERGGSRSGLLSATSRAGQGGVAQTKWPPGFPGRFSRPKAQGKNIMHPGLTGSLLRNSWVRYLPDPG